MESTLKTQLKVGIFLAVGLLVILTSIFMISGNSSLFSSQIKLHAHFDQVQGLAPGSVVSLAGLSVGNIESITFLPEQNKLDVVMNVDTRYSPRITEGALVEIRTQGALGDKFIYILPSDPRNAPLKDGDVLGVAPASDLFSIFSERGKETEKIFDIINELHTMAKTINHGGLLLKTMTNLSAASTNLRAASDQARVFTSGLEGDKTSAELRTSIRRLDSIMEKIDRGDGTLGALINDSSLHDQLRSFLGVSPRKQQIRSMIRTSIEKSDRP
ncbi:MAG TPA: MlaD family protein [Pseudobdellovibrionaceae bacterium]|nr:MlaD family protein [Pseudobdellovibrionaceae bacterium]